MSRQLSLPFPPDALPRVALGVCLGNRMVGVAVLTRERLLRAQVVGLRRLAREKRAGRLARVTRALTERFGPSRIAVVQLAGVRDDVVALDPEAVVAAATPTPTVTRYRAPDVRIALAQEGTHPTNRAVAHLLAERFPELARHAPEPAPSVEPTNGPWVPRRKYPTPKDRYYVRLFLAVAVALHDLEEELKTRLAA
ncbi:MAG: hypothetical protein ACOZNI_20145 [Myxococcota bacterium]